MYIYYALHNTRPVTGRLHVVACVAMKPHRISYAVAKHIVGLVCMKVLTKMLWKSITIPYNQSAGIWKSFHRHTRYYFDHNNLTNKTIVPNKNTLYWILLFFLNSARHRNWRVKHMKGARGINRWTNLTNSHTNFTGYKNICLFLLSGRNTEVFRHLCLDFFF